MAKSKGTTDPTTAADDARTAAEQDRAEANRTTRELGKDSNGNPTIYPSDVESVATTYNLTPPEAERLLLSGTVNEKEADKIKGERVVFRQHYEYVTNPTSSPLAAADQRAAETEQTEADRQAAADRIATDKTSPEAGPYGPDAVYTEVEAPVDTDHTSPHQPPKEEK